MLNIVTHYSLTSAYIFRVYKSGSEGPVILFLHGGGHSALSWAVLAVSQKTSVVLIFVRAEIILEWEEAMKLK